MKKIFLHAGKHKTGTTSIQKFMSYNRQTLLDAGFYPLSNNEVFSCLGLGYKTPNEMNNVTMSHLIIRSQLKTRIRYAHGDPFGTHDRFVLAKKLNRFLQEINHGNLVISAESFSFLRTDDEKRLYNALFDGLEVIPLVILRDRESWMNSWKIQTNDLFRSFGVAAGKDSLFDYSGQSWLLDDRSIEEFFGRSHVLQYEAIMRNHGSVIEPFIDFLGLTTKLFEKIDFFENLSTNKTIAR